jgi:hypothetical protein
MRWNWMPGAVLAVVIASPSYAQISVYIGSPPPAIVYEEAPPPPDPGFIWIEGYWRPVGHHYKWVRGRWERPPMKGHTGRIRITTTIAKAGNGMKDIGTARITTTAIGATMITDAGIAMGMTKGMTATDC